ncbi:MAG: hypothetical protein NT116_02905 [Candidatus Parcubacteria bacterium]|nr:hypothetical protein [Candidatus Parcubacteria bacterium]
MECRIVEHWETSLNNMLLLSSSLRTAKGAISFVVKEDEIKIRHYATFNSPIHTLTGFPSSNIFSQKKNWQESGSSNKCRLKAVSKLIYDSQQLLSTIETVYEIPESYTGPKYRKRTIIWQHAYAVKVLLRVEMEYQDGKKDIGEFSKVTRKGKSVLKIIWTCQYGPNKQNISFL